MAIFFFAALLSYFVYVFFFSAVSVVGVFAPFILLKFLQENLLPGLYILFSFIVLSGLLFFPYYLTLYYILSVGIPIAIVYLAHNSWRISIPQRFGLILAPLPLFVAAIVFIALFKEQTALIHAQLVDFIEQGVEPLLTSDLARLDPSNKAATFYNNRETIATYIIGLIPAVMYCYTYSVLFFTERIYYKSPYKGLLYLPDALLWVVVASGFCMIVPVPELRLPGLNGLLVAATLYFFRGFDVVKLKLMQWNIPPMAQFFITMMILIEVYLLAAVSILGFASIYIDFTKRKRAEDEDK
ncbi:MAG: YybS family protein [Deferribacteraceae bacterium]|jgi:hypothetical protein|nr:YybS family protein [Deferribacteraceae bacterium]